eukprot:Skav228853  [mRNA]  locus=scaffold1718:110836:115912:+ [translate_table: standard]
MFETHRDFRGSVWSNVSIKSVIQNLSDVGNLDCYWAGRNGKLFSVTWCYDSSFERMGWGNIVCAKRGDVWWEVLERFNPNSLNEPKRRLRHP